MIGIIESILRYFNDRGLVMSTMAIRVVEFSNGGTKLERFFPKNQHTQKKLLNFENWINGHHLRK